MGRLIINNLKVVFIGKTTIRLYLHIKADYRLSIKRLPIDNLL
jgi:hypothetical protein